MLRRPTPSSNPYISTSNEALAILAYTFPHFDFPSSFPQLKPTSISLVLRGLSPRLAD